jgi:hypothetical protein
VHKQVSNRRGDLNHNIWDERRNSFSWGINRPETGEQKFQRKCPYCEEELAIEVESLSKLSSRANRNRKGGIVITILIPVFLFALIGSFFLNNDLSAGLLISGACGLFFCLSFEILAFMPRKGYAVKGELLDAGANTLGWYSMQYIEKVES